MSTTEKAALSLQEAGATPVVPWYRRRSFLVPAVSAVVVAAVVVTDLPEANSRASEISNSVSVVSQVNDNVGPCSFALSEALTIYRELKAGSLTTPELSQVPALLTDDQNACSFTNDAIYNLSTMDVPGGAYGNELGQVVATATLWATSDALGAIEQIQLLETAPSDRAALTSLAKDLHMLRQDRTEAASELEDADQLLSTRLPQLRLAETPATPPRS
jgi:hypothetical protein